LDELRAGSETAEGYKMANIRHAVGQDGLFWQRRVGYGWDSFVM